MARSKRNCKKCGTQLVKVRDFIRQSGYPYYLECPKCTSQEVEKHNNKDKKAPYDVYIGRGSKWENPFIIGIAGTEEEVISKYEAYIMEERPDLISCLPELRGKTLGCYYTFEACHGDILKQMVEDELWLK